MALKMACASRTLLEYKTPESNKSVEQLPSYSPDFIPSEHLWKKVKKEATHLKYFPEFTHLQAEAIVSGTILAEEASGARDIR